MDSHDHKIIMEIMFATFLSLCAFLFTGYAKVSASNVPLYATKTSYDISIETFRPDSLNDRELHWLELSRRASGATPPPDGLDLCVPDGVYAIYRHGTRNPSDGDIEDVHSLINRLQNTDINPEFEFLRTATKIPVANASQLVETGWRELRELAGRIMTRFPELFPGNDVDISRYSFQSTNKSRTIDSTRAFVEGLVGANQTCSTVHSVESFMMECVEKEGAVITPTSTVIPHSPLDNDLLLRFYDVFEACTEAVNDGRTDAEQDGFRDGPEVGEVWEKVARKLAAPGAEPFTISRAEVILLTEICGYDRAINDDVNTWCRLFEVGDLYAPEYHSELKNYWNKAYGFDINYRISCTLAQDVLNFLEKRVATPMETPLANFKFAHSDTIVPITTLLGLFKNHQPLLVTSFQENINRTFRSAKIAPFASNVAFALYRCENNSEVSYNVQFLHNEYPMLLDFCANQFCTMDEFRKGLEFAIGTCDFDQECADALGSVSTTPEPNDGNGSDINYSVCLTFLVANVAFIRLSFIRSS